LKTFIAGNLGYAGPKGSQARVAAAGPPYRGRTAAQEGEALTDPLNPITGYLRSNVGAKRGLVAIDIDLPIACRHIARAEKSARSLHLRKDDERWLGWSCQSRPMSMITKRPRQG
jgi:hypothetical protein